VVTIVLYGGILWGLLPFRTGVSWEAHLFGLLGGFLAARLASVQSASK
jgi:membrane associated rhomboid family serine protease